MPDFSREMRTISRSRHRQRREFNAARGRRSSALARREIAPTAFARLAAHTRRKPSLSAKFDAAVDRDLVGGRGRPRAAVRVLPQRRVPAARRGAQQGGGAGAAAAAAADAGAEGVAADDPALARHLRARPPGRHLREADGGGDGAQRHRGARRRAAGAAAADQVGRARLAERAARRRLDRLLPPRLAPPRAGGGGGGRKSAALRAVCEQLRSAEKGGGDHSGRDPAQPGLLDFCYSRISVVLGADPPRRLPSASASSPPRASSPSSRCSSPRSRASPPIATSASLCRRCARRGCSSSRRTPPSRRRRASRTSRRSPRRWRASPAACSAPKCAPRWWRHCRG